MNRLSTIVTYVGILLWMGLVPQHLWGYADKDLAIWWHITATTLVLGWLLRPSNRESA